MTLSQRSTPPASLTEWREFFTDERVAQLNRAQQRCLRGIEDEDDELQLEVYADLYADLPKTKKKKKAPKKEKSPEEIEAEAVAIEKAKFAKIIDMKEKLKEKLPKDEEGNCILTNHLTLGFTRLSESEMKQLKQLSITMKNYLLTLELNKMMKGKEYKPYDDKSRRTYGAVKESKKECVLTGESIKVEFGKTAEEEYAVIECDEATQKYGAKLEEGETVLFNMSNGEQKQMKMKPCLRNSPIDKITGCECSIKYDYGNKIYKKNEEGVYQKVKKDWGCIPCNMKVVDGLKICVRHSKNELPEVWKREMLKVSEENIIRPEQ